MKHPLFEHINQFSTIRESEFERILSYFDLLHIPKKTLILEAGTLCRNNFFVIKGCLNMFFNNERGTERTVQFAIENWWITDYLAFQKNQITDFNIQAIENCEVLSISTDKQNELLEEFPQLEKYFRGIFQTAYGASLMRMKYIFDLSKEEIYFHFTEQFPQFAQRVPQYLIASFLGLTPEYVSEIRRKKRS